MGSGQYRSRQSKGGIEGAGGTYLNVKGDIVYVETFDIFQGSNMGRKGGTLVLWMGRGVTGGAGEQLCPD